MLTEKMKENEKKSKKSEKGAFQAQNRDWGGQISLLSLARVPSFGHVISGGFFDGADMSIQP